MAWTDFRVVFHDDHEFWRLFWILHLISSLCYALLFYTMYRNADKQCKSPKNCLLIATCTISTIHSHICVFVVIIGFFVDELYLPQNYKIPVSSPGVMYVMYVTQYIVLL